MVKDVRQLEKTVEDELYEFARYWLLRKFQFIDVARDEFESVVEPVVWYEDRPSLERVEACNMAFTEWLLFEWRYEREKTLLELYLERKGGSLSAETRDRLCQIFDTQFFSRFKIAYKDVPTGILTLFDERTNKRYDVVDSGAVEVGHWQDGVLAERIACVDGVWVCVGQLHLYDVSPSSKVGADGPGAVHAEDLEEGFNTEHLSFYLRLLRDVMGANGRYSSSLNAFRNNEEPTGVCLEDQLPEAEED